MLEMPNLLHHLPQRDKKTPSEIQGPAIRFDEIGRFSVILRF